MSLQAINRALSAYIEISRFRRPFSGFNGTHHCNISDRHMRQTRSFRKISRPKTRPKRQPLRKFVAQHSNIQILKIFGKSFVSSNFTRTKINVRDTCLAFKNNPKERLISLWGYLGVRSDLSKMLSFVPLKDVASEDYIQIVSSPQTSTSIIHKRLKSIRPYEPVVVTGILRPKPLRAKHGEGESSAARGFNETAEISLKMIKVLNKLHPDIVLKDGAKYGPGQRLQRLRTDAALRNALGTRAKIMRLCEDHLQTWMQIETPLLYKSTSEGASEYLVPTRRKGLAYALPQSPQQFKQILMASGIHKYHQFARCFRDEDLRADRQPEFTQLDMEMSFANGGTIRHLVESHLIVPIWKAMLNADLRKPFRTMTYKEAMLDYGSDKPDLRIPYKIRPAMESILSSALKAKITPLKDPIIDALVIPFNAQPERVRIMVSQFLDSDQASRYRRNPDGAPGVFIIDSSKPMRGLSAFGYEAVEKFEKFYSILNDGYLIVLQARKNAHLSGGSTELGNFRIALHGAAVDAGLLQPLPWKFFKPLWVIDFPLFSPSTKGEPGQGGKNGIQSTHHPFTSPKTIQDVALLFRKPLQAIGDHYDLVINGEEIGGGSVRIHQAALQELIFREVLKMEEEKIAEFSPLLEALKAACPPHAGIALGFDRMVAMVYSHMIRKKVSMRDVIAFPKSGSGDDLMMKSPGPMSEDQLQRYHLRLRD